MGVSLQKIWFNAVLQLAWLLLSHGLQKVIPLTPDSPVQIATTSSAETYSFCFKEPEDFTLTRLFTEVQITVQSKEGREFPWFSVRGVSTDDFHGNIETAVLRILNVSEEEKDIHVIPIHEKKSFLRDLLSSCPNPVLSKDRSECAMTFSPFGEACLILNPERNTKLVASLKIEFNYQRLVALFVGIVLLLLAHTVSKSKIFQYLAVSVLFVLCGVLVLGLYAGNRVVSGGRSERELSLFRPSTGFAALITGWYGASAVWFVRTHFRSILLSHWEVLLGYVVVMALSGLLFTYLVRKNESIKHYFRVLVKWLIRIGGTVLIYNSFASPLVSTVFFGILILLYVVRSCFKATAKFFAFKSSSKKA